MPEWCPKCNAMLPEGLDQCPRCGKRLHRKSNSEYSTRDIAWISAYVLGIVLIPVVLVIIIGLICVYLGR
jgi:uncharacterized paraquat-inducible protein A